MAKPRCLSLLAVPLLLPAAGWAQAIVEPGTMRVEIPRAQEAVRQPPRPVAPERNPSPQAVPGVVCQAHGCMDKDARRYQGGTGQTYLDNAGRPCHRNGSWLQCF